MLTEEQIQRLTKKLADEHGYDEEECKERVRSMVKDCSEFFNAFLPEDKKELFKKAFDGEFFEDIIQISLSLLKQICVHY